MSLYVYECEIIDWCDGDTCDVEIDVGFKIKLAQRVRVAGINCHELHSSDMHEKQLGIADKLHAMELLPSGTKTLVETFKPTQPTEKWGRYLAKIALPDGRDFATVMIADGHAIAWDGRGQRPS